MSLACLQEETEAITPQPEIKETTVAIEITSSAFTQGNSIPAQYSCYSDEVSPKLSWSGIPEGTKTIAVILDDPHAPGGTWIHWVVYGISPDDGGLPEGVPPSDTLEGAPGRARTTSAGQATAGRVPSGADRTATSSRSMRWTLILF